MIVISILAVIVWNFWPEFVSINLAKLAEKPHALCLGFAPESSYREFYQAIVCGSPISESFFKFFLKNSGLLHLIVVSGSHLIFLGILIDTLFLKRISFKWKFVLLSVYTLISNAQPPVVRALAGLTLAHLNQEKKLFWTRYQQTWICMVLTLCLFPEWISSMSFLLSSCAALALCLTSSLKGVQKHVAIYFILIPVLLPLGPPHPLSAILNAFVAPLLGLVLFPLCLVSFVFPISWAVDWLWLALSQFLAAVTGPFIPIDRVYVPKPYLWAYVIGLNLVTILIYTIVRRKNAHLN